MTIEHWKTEMMTAWPTMPLAAWEKINEIAKDVERQAITENLGGQEAVRKLFDEGVKSRSDYEITRAVDEIRSRYGYIDRCLNDIVYNATEILKGRPVGR